jgi:hypothetical protein
MEALTIISLIIGWLTAIIMYPYIQRAPVHGPDSNIVRKEVFIKDGKYYKYEPIPYLCGTSRSI